MSSPLNPLGDYIVAIPEEASTKTAGGLYLPDNAQEKPKTAGVVATGPDVKKVKVGDRIVCKGYGPEKLDIDNREYILVKEEDILAKVK